jgi:acetyl esterase/lipase
MRRLLIGLTAGFLLFAAAARRRDRVLSFVFPAWVAITPDISYGPSPEQLLDVMRARWTASPPLPCAMVLHGGAWTGGDRESMRVRFCSFYLRHGFRVVNVEYRVGAILPAAEDARRALAWVFDHAEEYGIDAGRIVVVGASAGAHLGLLAAFQSQHRPAAVIDFYGVTDMTDMLWIPSIRRILPAEDPEAAARLVSPVTYLRPPIPPVLAIHGSEDSIVPLQESHKLTEAVRRAGGIAEEIVIGGANHGFTPAEQDIADEAILRFLRSRAILR